jgi:hypothetical protein
MADSTTEIDLDSVIDRLLEGELALSHVDGEEDERLGGCRCGRGGDGCYGCSPLPLEFDSGVDAIHTRSAIADHRGMIPRDLADQIPARRKMSCWSSVCRFSWK